MLRLHAKHPRFLEKSLGIIQGKQNVNDWYKLCATGCMTQHKTILQLWDIKNFTLCGIMNATTADLMEKIQDGNMCSYLSDGRIARLSAMTEG